jgi:ketosteroid isomerase-like protein
MSEHDAILFANAAFYAAFTARDMAALEKVWAKDKPLSCVHPGRSAITGREAVMRSWRAILDNPEAPRISCHGEKIQVHGDTAVVTCVEQLALASGAQFLMATNVFVRTGSIWAMVHHHAGPVQVDPGSIAAERKPALN